MKLFLCSSLLILIVAAKLASAENSSSFLGRLLNEAGNDGNGYGNGNSKNVKCSKDPKVCLQYGTNENGKSRSPYCCGNKCVDLLSDNQNCGKCNNTCKFSTGCCNGVCSNFAYDTNNCGRCGNRCAKGSHCVYGLCSYA